MSQPLVYFATIRPQPQHFVAARDAVMAIVPQTQEEPGCREFRLFTDPDGTQLHIMESWRDQAAFDFHHAQDYTRAVFESYKEWLAEPPILTPLTVVAG